MTRRLPPPPTTRIRIVDDDNEPCRCDEGFIRLRRHLLQTESPDGTSSPPFRYDEVERSALDAVVIVAHYRSNAGSEIVFLRTALRPPVALRSGDESPIPEPTPSGHLWEVPAGLVERYERSEEGLRRCAARELFEELGFDLSPVEMVPLGPSTFPAPAIIGERHFFFHCVVDPQKRREPPGDGSPLEVLATVTEVDLDEAIELTRSGDIEDAKSEIALRRLREIVP